MKIRAFPSGVGAGCSLQSFVKNKRIFSAIPNANQGSVARFAS
jgi:hypothetical protein